MGMVGYPLIFSQYDDIQYIFFGLGWIMSDKISTKINLQVKISSEIKQTGQFRNKRKQFSIKRYQCYKKNVYRTRNHKRWRMFLQLQKRISSYVLKCFKGCVDMYWNVLKGQHAIFLKCYLPVLPISFHFQLSFLHFLCYVSRCVSGVVGLCRCGCLSDSSCSGIKLSFW